MLIARSPHRVSFFGGGSDFTDHIKETDSKSSIFGTAINLYCYVSAIFPKTSVAEKYRISYRQTDSSNYLKDLQHDLGRETLRYFKFDQPIHISSMSEVPASSGLGTSSAFTCALISILSEKLKLNHTQTDIAEIAIEIERKRAKHFGGIQDQIWSSFGGTGFYDLKTDKYKRVNAPEDFIIMLKKNSYLFFLGNTRSSSTALQKNEKKMQNSKKILLENRNRLAAISHSFHDEMANLKGVSLKKFFQDSLVTSWAEKRKQISIDKESMNQIESIERLKIPFKLCGAGGSGFLYLFMDNKSKKNFFSQNKNYKKNLIKVEPSAQGTSIIFKNV